ncbi:hypothetical protein VQL36_14625 [Chengkuizengella sp. SCS-71B]|uniref:hypothetical protein n=1 Tax=Chengkuizengella sp. SCS-71B TaxID=3115290 RepID=UPI0032C2180C
MKKYFVVLKNHDPIRVKVNWDVNLPNNPDYDDILQNWIEHNYGEINYDAWEISDFECHSI